MKKLYIFLGLLCLTLIPFGKICAMEITQEYSDNVVVDREAYINWMIKKHNISQEKAESFLNQLIEIRN